MTTTERAMRYVHDAWADLPEPWRSVVLYAALLVAGATAWLAVVGALSLLLGLAP